ncbi:MAG: HAD family phosphatase [Verrucomicrobia bacterium]|nr:HAD family phosphatase [Verrucomicrobiota bacterium]MBV8377761.1 HAD family phosphatase [Verrucomicrobiota bacterium]
MPVFTPPKKRYLGYIFDCDGTLADSMPVHYRAWVDTVQKYGGQIPEDLFYALGGWPSAKIVEFLNQRFGTALNPAIVASEKENLYLERIGTIQPIRQVVNFAREVAEFAKIAVASGGILPVVKRTLETIGCKDFFPVIVTSEQVKRGKPFPDMFLEAARRMSVPPCDCLVLEDSVAGFEAAKAAGMDYVIVGRP